jgi:hypothetical protein
MNNIDAHRGAECGAESNSNHITGDLSKGVYQSLTKPRPARSELPTLVKTIS